MPYILHQVKVKHDQMFYMSCPILELSSSAFHIARENVCGHPPIYLCWVEEVDDAGNLALIYE
jgi:hypothetical protein